MKICIYGAGAGGGHFAVKLAHAGHVVSVIARGPQLEAIRRRGLRLLSGAEVLEAKVWASDDPKDIGPQDAVIVTVKATALAEIADKLAPLVSRKTSIIFPQNGIPWWYPLGLSVACPTPPKLPIFSHGTHLYRVMRQDQVIGGIIYSANEIISPGVVKNNSPSYNRLDIGAIDDRETKEVSDLRVVLNEAGLLSHPMNNIREAVWRKLLANMSGSTIALVTRKKSSACREDAAMCDIFRRLVAEGAAIAASNGFQLDFDADAMLARLADHKPSILQDYEQKRQMEIAEILLAPVAFARVGSVATPTLDVFAALAKNMAAERGLYSA